MNSEPISIKEGDWYNTKRGYIIRIDGITDISIIVTSHATGNKIVLSKDDAKYFTPTKEPSTPPGTVVSSINTDMKLCKRYPHMIPQTMYQVMRTVKHANIDRNETTSKGKSCTRCKIRCACGEERDIRIQDLRLIKICNNCYKKIQKEKLKQFLNSRKLKDKQK